MTRRSRSCGRNRKQENRQGGWPALEIDHDLHVLSHGLAEPRHAPFDVIDAADRGGEVRVEYEDDLECPVAFFRPDRGRKGEMALYQSGGRSSEALP